MTPFRAIARFLRKPRAAAALSLVVLASLAAVIAGPAVAALTGPRPSDHNVAFAVVTLLKREHLSRHPLDDEISHRWMKNFLKTLDPLKVYFTQADVESFNRYRDQLDDMARRGDISFAYMVFNRFQERINERVKLVDELLKLNHDFTVDESISTDPDRYSYAKNDAEVRESWRKRVKYDMLVLKSDEKEKLEGEAAKKKISRKYHSIAKRMGQIDANELLEMYLTSLTSSFDPHTSFMSAESLENFIIQMRLNLEGIGAALQFDDGYTVVQKIIPGGAAAKDGRLKKEDRIVGVGEGEEGPVVDTVDMKLNDVVKMIRGARGTTVRLKVIPKGENTPKIYGITRAQIELSDSEARSQIFEEGRKPNGKPYKVGVIDLPSFYMDMDAAREGAEEFKSTTRDVAKLLDEFNRKGVDAVIVDLRRNGGGSLTEAINVTGLFIDRGPVVQVKDADGRIQHLDDERSGMLWSGPLVVLTSKLSASASEIFAGAIQDYKRGLVVGDTSTHGKGTVQTLLDLSQALHVSKPLGALKVTMQQFYRPSGDSTQNRGVLADIELPSVISQLDELGEAHLDYAMKFDRIEPSPYRRVSMIDNRLVSEIRSRSAHRREQSKDFAKVLRRIALYNEQKERKQVSLNESKFMSDRAEINAEREEEKELDELSDPNRPVVKRDFYFNEALAITLDYAKLLRPDATTLIGRN